MFRNGFAKTSKIYKSLGQFDYGLLNCTADRIQQHIIKKNHYKCVYIGEVEEGTDIPNGVGIEVLNNGDIQEGYWKDGEPMSDMKWRGINNNGSYAIMESKDSKSNWRAVAYNANKGAKFIGETNKENNNCKGLIQYNDGTKYVGESNEFNKHGQGTLYSSSGKILRSGRWEDNKFMGTK